MNGLNGGRLSIASCSLGGATLAMNIASEYAFNRKAFGKKIFDLKKHDLSKIYSKLVGSRILVRQACIEYDKDKESRAL